LGDLGIWGGHRHSVNSIGAITSLTKASLGPPSSLQTFSWINFYFHVFSLPAFLSRVQKAPGLWAIHVCIGKHPTLPSDLCPLVAESSPANWLFPYAAQHRGGHRWPFSQTAEGPRRGQALSPKARQTSFYNRSSLLKASSPLECP
jgi:hypothetical protein